MDGVTIVSHPLVQHKLTLLRKKDISTKSFRELLKEIGMLLCYEVTRDLPLADIEIETPLAQMKSPQIAGKKLVFAPVLRAGVTFAEGMLDLVPTARIAHIGLYREPETFTAVEYFFKAPSDLHERLVIVISPVLATANSAVAAVDRLKERGANDIRLVCLIGAPEGVERMRGIHPDVPIWLAAIDQGLDGNAYIVPGLGDAGDRAYGTKEVIEHRSAGSVRRSRRFRQRFEMTRHPLTAFDRPKLRLFRPAAVEHVWASGVEAATAGRIDRARHVAL